MTATAEKVVILGGGLGALSAAWELTDPALGGRYDVTVRQLGWRLGGKAASGRNRQLDNRIEEHGLHMMMGWYEQTLSMMRACYAEWQPPQGTQLTTFDQAFLPQRKVTLPSDVGSDGDVDWRLITITFPHLPGRAGDPDEVSPLRLLIDLVGVLHEPARRLGIEPRPAQDDSTWHGHMLARSLGELFDPFHLLKELEHLLETVARWIEQEGDRLEGDLRALWVFLQLGVAMAKGLLIDVVPFGSKGWDRIDHLDLKDWLASHGAATPEISFSAPIRAFYDLAFAYPGGDGSQWQNAQIAAGTTLHTMLRMALTYRDAPLFKMTAGMGDIMMAPLYDVLRERGVRFEFFNRVEGLRLSPDAASVASIDVSRQASLVGDGYDPLFNAGGVRSWPSTPDWNQLVDGARLEAEGVNFESAWCDETVDSFTLTHGVDFDHVVLGISLGALGSITSELADASDAWSAMLDIPTVMTRAAQLWTIPDLEGLGWTVGPSVCAGYEPPFDSFADMTQVIAAEEWNGAPPGSVQYFCSPLYQADGDPYDDPGYPQQKYDEVVGDARSWLEDSAAVVFPEAVNDDGGFDTNLLRADYPGDRLEQQYFRANIDPSERYVLTPPGTTTLRLPPGDSGFVNLFLAGDWVRTSINGGCAEAAVEGGRLAAAAIVKRP